MFCRDKLVLRCLLASAGLTLYGAVSADALEGWTAARARFSVEGRIQEVLTVDLDGDGLRDLVILHVVGQGRQARRFGALFWGRAPSRSAAAPDFQWALDPRAVAFDVFRDEETTAALGASTASPSGSGNNRAADELYSLRSDGIYRHLFRRSSPLGGEERTTTEARRIRKADLGHLVAPADDALAFDFVRRWRGQVREAFVPALPNPLLLTLEESPCPRRVLSLLPQATYGISALLAGAPSSSLAARYGFPLPATADQDGDGDLELIFYREEQLFVADPGSVSRDSLPAGANVDGGSGGCGRIPVTQWPVEIFATGDDPTEPFFRAPRLLDLNGDGRVDLLMNLFRDAGFFDLRGRLMVFLGRPDGTFASEADEVLSLDHAQYHLMHLADLQGDGRRELIVPTAKLGVLGVVRAVTGRKAAFSLHTFSQAASPRPQNGAIYGAPRALKPGLKVALSERYDISAVFLAELTGDRLQDLVLGTQEDEVCVHAGRQDGRHWSFEPKAGICFEADPFAIYRAEDLNGDGREELLAYGQRGAGRRRLTVLSFTAAGPP